MNKSTDYSSGVTGLVFVMKKILILCLLLVGCNSPLNTPEPDRGFVRISYINSLPPEKVKEMLIACVNSQRCYDVIEKQMKYEQYI
jgi:hypothetical protein